ncbi:MAG: translocation/assembly module TamB domain-containing protein [Acidobacteria bacterium]|nr:translocation/assembly module TamB domain-containing protein [Acidobacteriota bacterium]
MKRKKAWLVGLAAMSIILLVFIFYKLFINQIVLSALNHYLDENFGSSVSAASCDFSIFSLRFSMEQPVFCARGMRPNRAFLKVEKISLQITPDLILGKKIHFKHIYFYKPRVLVEILKDGSNNLPVIKQAEEVSAIPEFIIDQLAMKETRLVLRHETKRLTILSPLLNIGMKLKEKSDHQLSIDNLGPGELYFNGRKKAINKLHMDGQISHKRMAIAKAVIQIEKSELEFSGILNNWLSMQLNMQVKGNVSPGDYADLLAPGNVSHELASLGRFSFGFQFFQDQEFLEIKKIHVSALGGEILGNAAFSLQTEKNPNHLFFKWKDLDFSLIKGVLPINLFSYGSGNVDATFSALKLSETKGSLSARFKPKAMSPQNQEGMALAGDVSLTFFQGAIFVKNASLRSQGNRIKGEFNIEKERIFGSIHGKIDHLRRILLPLSPFSDHLRLLAEKKIDGEMVIAGKISGTMAKPVLQVEFTQGKIKNLTRSPLAFAGSLFLKNQILRISNIRISQSWGTVILSGTIPGGPEGKGMDLQVQASRLDLIHLGKELPFELPPMRGILDFNVRLTKKTDAPFLFNTMVEGNFSLANFYFKQMQLGNVQGKCNSTKEKIEFLFQIPSSHSEIYGAMDLHKPFQTKIGFSIRTGSIKEFLKLLPVPFHNGLSGTITSQAQVTFLPLQFRESLAISFEASDLLIASGKQNIRNKNPLRLAYRSGGLIAESVSLIADRLEISVFGELPFKPMPGKEITISAKGKGNFINILLPDLFFEGNLNAKAAIKGSLTNPAFSASLQVEQGRLLISSQTLPLTNMQLHLELKENSLILHSIRFHIQEGEVIGKGTLPLSFLKLPIADLTTPQIDEVYDVDLAIAHCPLASLETFLAVNLPENTTGDVSGNIHLQGKNSDLADLVCTATLTLDDLSIKGMPFYLEGPIKIVSNEKRIILREVVLIGQDDLQLVMKGFVGLQKEKPLDFSMKGKLDSQVFLGFFPELAGSGSIAFELNIGGTIKDMEWNGKIEVMNNNLQFGASNLFFNQLNGAVNMHNGKFAIERLTGNLNGGTIELKGSVALENQQQPSVDMQLRMADVKFNFPKGLFTNLSGQLDLLSSRQEYFLKGNIELNGGKYNESFNVGSYLYDFLINKKEIITESEDADLEKRFKLNIHLKTPQAIVVDNNVCRSELNADLTIGGTYFQPQLSGRIFVKEGGSIFFGNRIFSIEKGQINFVNPNMIEPDFHIDSRTQIGSYDIKLALNGTPQTFLASFSSVPPLSEQSIVSLLATGKAPDDLSGSILYETGNTALNYLSYAVTGKMEELIKKNLNLQSFRIDGSLLSSKEDPGAKITIGKNITPKLELTYSQGLRQTQNPTWMLNYKPVKSLNFQGIQSNTDLYTMGVQYQLRFHSVKEAIKNADSNVEKLKPLHIEKIQIEGDPVLALPAIMKRIKQKPGHVFSFIKFQEDEEHIRRLYQKNDYLSVKISANYYPGKGGVKLVYRIAAGPKVFLRFLAVGMTKSLRKKCTKQWLQGQFDAQRVSNVIGELTQFFYRKKYYLVKVSSNRVEKDHELIYFFSIKKGIEFNHIEYDFKGNRQVADKEILRELKNLRRDGRLFSESDEVRSKLEKYYKKNGFLNVKISPPQVSFHDLERTAVIRFHIDENILFRINRISFSGSQIVPEPELMDLLKLQEGAPIFTLQANDPTAKIEEYYRKKGFNQVQVALKSVLAVDKGLVNLEFAISEGAQGLISEIKIIGNKDTRESVIVRELTFKVGDIVDFYEINRSRKKLYDLGIFDLVDFELTAAGAMTPQSAHLEETKDDEQKKYFQVQIKVEESPVYRLKVGGQYDTDSQFAARLEGEHRNLFGAAHSIGAGFQWGSKETDVRGYYRFPYLLFNKVNTIVSLFSNKKEESSFRNDRQGLTVQQQVNLWKSSIFSWNYTWEKSITFNNQDHGMAAQSADVAHVTFGYYDDKRDNIFNPSKGFFISSSIQHAAKILGSDYSFIRYSGQFDFYKRLMPHLTWATSLGVGLVNELGQELSLAEKFFASGRSVIRGFTSNEVGPVNAINGQASGGDALLIFRQELRWQILPLISVVTFTDWGNVFARAADYNIFKLRKSAGIGVRFHLQPLLIRFDWGMKLDRRSGEKHSSFYFGVGHIF